MDAAGIKIPSIYDGKSLLPVVENPNTQARASLPIVQVWGPKATHCLTVMDEQYKYVYWYYEDDDNEVYPTEELFDIVNDPYEMVNIVKMPEHKKQLE